jgi:nucleotide-binding universal stress UspA family protein
VLVGVDGSDTATAAVDLAAREAHARRVPLLLVHGYQKATIRSRLEAGGAGSSLVELSRGASLVVVGAGGTDGFPGPRRGPEAEFVVAHAHAPVIVVRPATASVGSSDPIIVGVDGSASGQAALAFAFEEADARGAPVLPLFAWYRLPASNLGPVRPLNYWPVEARAEAARMLAEAMAGKAEEYPDVRVRPIVLFDPQPAAVLIKASRWAGLVVVGRRGRGRLAHRLVGSVSDALVGRANCPVAVVGCPV